MNALPRYHFVEPHGFVSCAAIALLSVACGLLAWGALVLFYIIAG